MPFTASDSDITFLDAAYKADNRLSLPYILSTSMVGVLYLVYPIATSSYEYLSKGSTTWVMPMRSMSVKYKIMKFIFLTKTPIRSFIYDLTKFPYYELTYLWFVQSTFLSAFGATGIDTLFYAASFNLSGHFQAIQNRFCHLQYETVQQCSNGKRTRLSREFLALIRYHNNILDQCTELTNVYKPILFCHFLISSVQICVIAYQLTLVRIFKTIYCVYYKFDILAISGADGICNIYYFSDGNNISMFCLLPWWDAIGSGGNYSIVKLGRIGRIL